MPEKAEAMRPPDAAAGEKQAKKAEKARLKAEKKENRKNSRKRSIVLLVILFMLIIMSGVFLYFSLIHDWGNVRTALLTEINKLDPNFHTLQAEKIEQYNEARAQLEKDQADLAKERSDFQAYRTAQTAEIERLRKEAETLAAFVQPIYRQNLSEEKILEIQKLSEFYSGMDAQTAASILSRLSDDTHVAVILYYMSSDKASSILSNMSADLAARITTILVKD